MLVLAIAASDFAGAAEGSDHSTGGKDSYDRYCVDCHHVTLRGTGHGPPLNGAQFREHWAAKPPAELAQFIRTAMSSTMPASDIQQRVRGNCSISAPEQRHRGNPPRGSKSGRVLGDIAGGRHRAGGWSNRETRPLSPVTDSMLRAPPDGAWLNWRRTLDGQGYIPLAQINRANVAAAAGLGPDDGEGSNQITPLVHDGVMYLTHPGNVVQALDAANGLVDLGVRLSVPTRLRRSAGRLAPSRSTRTRSFSRPMTQR